MSDIHLGEMRVDGPDVYVDSVYIMNVGLKENQEIKSRVIEMSSTVEYFKYFIPILSQICRVLHIVIWFRPSLPLK